MFDHLLLIQPEEESIILQTAQGNDIPNDIAPEPDQGAVAAYGEIRAQHLFWIDRRPPCGRYNCHGLVFANRRTSIREDGHVHTILSDDGYRTLHPGEMPQPGDIGLYRGAGVGIVHSCLVVESPPTNMLIQVADAARVISKWCDWGGEAVHVGSDVHFPGFQCGLEFWTDRP